jgi:RNA polymerase sigma-70 factor (ECF subfamily)
MAQRLRIIPVNERFATTHWSLVLAAGKGASADAQQALAALCQTYWYPLYAYVRRQGHQPDDAQDVSTPGRRSGTSGRR